jgi:hypothetical protein
MLFHFQGHLLDRVALKGVVRHSVTSLKSFDVILNYTAVSASDLYRSVSVYLNRRGFTALAGLEGIKKRPLRRSDPCQRTLTHPYAVCLS